MHYSFKSMSFLSKSSIRSLQGYKTFFYIWFFFFVIIIRIFIGVWYYDFIVRYMSALSILSSCNLTFVIVLNTTYHSFCYDTHYRKKVVKYYFSFFACYLQVYFKPPPWLEHNQHTHTIVTVCVWFVALRYVMHANNIG